ACRNRSNSAPSTRSCRRDARPERPSLGHAQRGPRRLRPPCRSTGERSSSALQVHPPPELEVPQPALILVLFALAVHAEEAVFARRNLPGQAHAHAPRARRARGSRSEEHTSEL